jgi:hypothetical protein
MHLTPNNPKAGETILKNFYTTRTRMKGTGISGLGGIRTHRPVEISPVTFPFFSGKCFKEILA